jgi:hypothetical protein
MYHDLAIVQAEYSRRRAALRAEMSEGLDEGRAALVAAAAVDAAYLRHTLAQDEARTLQAEMGPGFLVLARRDGSVDVTPLVPRYQTSAEARAVTTARIAEGKRLDDARWAEREARRLEAAARFVAAKEALISVGPAGFDPLTVNPPEPPVTSSTGQVAPFMVRRD